VSFDTFCTHFDVNELSDGRRWHDVGFVVADGSTGEMVRAVEHEVTWRPGTRWMQRFELDLLPWEGEPHHLVFEPLYDFQMLGIGYGHPEWSHGVWKGELEVGAESWDLPVGDPTALHHVHVQTLSRATLTGPLGTHTGIGILETLVIGPHEPTGLTGILDPAT
jgi:hypothetical protein